MFKITKMPTIVCPNCKSKITFTEDNLEENGVEGEEREQGDAVTVTYKLVNCCPKCGREHYYQFSATEYPEGLLEGVSNIKSSADEIDIDVRVKLKSQEEL